MRRTEVEIATYAPFPTLRFHLDRSTPFSVLADLVSPLCPLEEQSLCLFSGRSLPSGSLDADYVHLRLGVRLLGGKGGFGSQLRAAGGKMSSKRTENKNSCRTLDGRRLSTVREAEKLAQYIASAPQREQARKDEAAKKLKDLQDKIARLEEDANNGGKRRLDEDDNFVEENQQLVDGVKDAMAAAMAKRKKKKLNPKADAPVASTSKIADETAPAVAATA